MGGWVGGWVGGWTDSENRANLSSTSTSTGTGTELGKNYTIIPMIVEINCNSIIIMIITISFGPGLIFR